MKGLVSFLAVMTLAAFWILGVNFAEIRTGPAMILQAFLLLIAGSGLVCRKVRFNRLVSLSLLLVGCYFIWRTSEGGPQSLAVADVFLIMIFSFGIIMISVWRSANERVFDSSLLCVVGLLVLANLGVAIWQWKADPTFLMFEARVNVDRQASGLLTHHNPFAAMMVGFLSYMVAALLMTKEIKWRILSLLGVLATVGSVALSQSRGGSIAMAAALVATIIGAILVKHFQKDRSAGKIAIYGLLGLVIMLFLAGGYFAFVEEGRGKDLFGGGIRPALYQLATGFFLESPITGNGPRAFSYLSAQGWDWADNGWVSAMPDFAHNEYLQTLVDYGVVGFLGITVVFTILMIQTAIRVGSGEDSQSVKSDILLVGAIAGLAGFAVQIFFSFLAHVPSTLMLLACHLGILSSFSAKMPTGVFTKITSRLLGLFLLVGAGWIGWQGSQFSKSWWALETAKKRGSVTKLVETFYSVGEITSQSKYYAEGAASALQAAKSTEVSHDQKDFVELALTGYQRAYDLNPEAPEGASGYAVVLSMLGRHSEARGWYELSLKNAGGVSSRVGFSQTMGIGLYQSALAVSKEDPEGAESDLRLAVIRTRGGQYVGESKDQFQSRRKQRAFMLKWLQYLEGRRLYEEGDGLWKKRQASRGLALMLAAEKRYRATLKQMIDFDPRWELEWTQLQANIKLLKGAKITPEKISKEEIQSIALGPFKDGLASGGLKR